MGDEGKAVGFPRLTALLCLGGSNLTHTQQALQILTCLDGRPFFLWRLPAVGFPGRAGSWEFIRFDNPSRRVGDPRHCMGTKAKPLAHAMPLAALLSLSRVQARLRKKGRRPAGCATGAQEDPASNRGRPVGVCLRSRYLTIAPPRGGIAGMRDFGPRPTRRATAIDALDLVVVRTLPASRAACLRRTHVRFGSKADIAAPPTDVRFTPKSGRTPDGHRYGTHLQVQDHRHLRN